MKCPQCSASNTDQARFCSNCGQALIDAPESSAKAAFSLDRYLPPELAARLQAARAGGQAAGERRVITCLFCDVSGSTAAAERLDPEDWAEIMNGAFDHMIRPIYKYEGTVVRLMGDAILAFFGAPLGHEDDPQRAVLAGLEIHAGIQPFQREVRNRHEIDLSVRVGINTGLVVVGEIGSDLRMEYTAMGDAVNLAARMEQSAAPGSVQISDETHKLVAPFFDFEDLGERQVKGKAEPVRTFRVLAVRSMPGQLRGLEGLTSPLVGRTPELSLIEQRLSALQGGSGGMLAVVGDAGLGKSTLVAEARRRRPGDQPGSWLEGHALSYTRSTSYYLWRQVIRQSIGAGESDAPPQVREKLRFGCECCSLPGGDLPFLEAILAVESEASLKVLSGHHGEELRERITQAARGYLCALAVESPLVICLDDLHWADEASLSLLERVADLVDRNRMLFICMLRPDLEAPAWTSIETLREELRARCDRIVLEPLAAADSLAMLGNLLNLPELPRGLRELILSKAEGNPFFVEEIIRALIDDGQIVPAGAGWQVPQELNPVSLPNTLAGLLSARIDRLPEATRQLLQTAAVLGRSFESGVLENLLEQPQPLSDHLALLVRSGLLVPDETGSGKYNFRHALIQEAAYSSILLKRRRQLHLRAAESLEKLYAARIEEYAGLLAGHFHAAGDARSVLYDTLAGDSAARLYANAEAVEHYGRALEAAQRAGAEPAQLAELFGKFGEALEQCGRHEQALQNYLAMETLGRQQGRPALELSALMSRAKVYSTFTSLHDPALAEATLQQALELARSLGDQSAQARLHWNLLLTDLFSKRLPEAAEHGRAALDLARAGQDRELLAFILNDLARVHSGLGEFQRAYVTVQEARALWVELDNQAMLADSLGVEAEARHADGDYERMLELMRQALQINERIGNLWGQSYARILMGLAHFDRGEADLALEMATEGIRLGDQCGLLASSIGVRCDLAWMYGQYGDLGKGLALAHEALEILEVKQPAWRALAVAMQVRLHLLHGDMASAESAAGSAPLEPIPIPYPHYTILLSMANIELALARHEYEKGLLFADDLLNQVSAATRPGMPEILCGKAAALAGLGKLQAAREILEQADGIAARLGAEQDRWRVLAAEAGLAAQMGDRAQAEHCRAAAVAIVAKIAGRLEGAGLNEFFLSRPEVRALIG